MWLEKAIYTDNLYALGCQGLIIMVHTWKERYEQKKAFPFIYEVGRFVFYVINANQTLTQISW